MEAMRALQKMRARQKGVSAASLALGKKIAKTDEISDVGRIVMVYLRIYLTPFLLLVLWDAEKSPVLAKKIIVYLVVYRL